MTKQEWLEYADSVPESTDCWQVEGFREAVTLLEDPVEEE